MSIDGQMTCSTCGDAPDGLHECPECGRSTTRRAGSIYFMYDNHTFRRLAAVGLREQIEQCLARGSYGYAVMRDPAGKKILWESFRGDGENPSRITRFVRGVEGGENEPR